MDPSSLVLGIALGYVAQTLVRLVAAVLRTALTGTPQQRARKTRRGA